MRPFTTLSMVLAAALLAGCNGSAPPDPDRAGSPAPTEPVEEPAAAEQPITYAGPPFTFNVATGASSTDFSWSVQVPTGGWALSFAGGFSDPRINHGGVRVILRKPDPNAMVTQALETHRGDYRNSAKAFDTAELMVKLLEHDQAEEDEDYQRAAWWSAR